MLTVEDYTRRATLKGCGFIQVFLGVTALPAAIAKLVMQSGNGDPTYSGIWTSLLYILVGVLSIQCARLESPPSRGMLNACIGLNYFIWVISFIAIGVLIWAAVTAKLGGLIAVAIIPLVAIVGVTITAVVYATKIKNALSTTEHIPKVGFHGTNYLHTA